MDRKELELAMNLFRRGQAAVYNLLQRARASGQPETLAGLARTLCPAAELGVKLVTGQIELTEAGKAQLSDSLAEYNIELEP